VIQMKVVIGCIVVVLALTIIAIFYNIVLHLKQNQSEEIIVNLRDKIEHQDKKQRYLLANLTEDVIKLSEQIVIIESDLEDLKNATHDIQELKKMQVELLDSIQNGDSDQFTEAIDNLSLNYLSSSSIQAPYLFSIMLPFILNLAINN